MSYNIGLVSISFRGCSPEEIIKAEEMKPGETETIEAEEMKPGEMETIKEEETDPAAEEKNPLPFCPPDDCITELFRKRRSFQPFPDEEIRDCVQILPCDVLMLQQKGWQIGRSSFLQHGYYHHHHLLLGKTSDGAFLLGVPGIRNAQEEYMAQIFGYERFKLSGICDRGKTFGYWCRRIENQPLRHA